MWLTFAMCTCSILKIPVSSEAAHLRQDVWEVLTHRSEGLPVEGQVVGPLVQEATALLIQALGGTQRRE